MPYRRCLRVGCTLLTTSSYCPAHRRDRNLARAQLPTIYLRDNATCQLCKEHVLPPGTPGSLGPTLDHIIPMADGGTDHPSNLRLAHRGCNSRRG